MRSLLRMIASTIAITLIIFVGGELLLPPIVSGVIEDGFAREVDSVDYVTSSARALPSLRLLAGSADYVTIEARQVAINGLPIHALVLEARNIVIDPWVLWRDKKLSYRAADRLSATVILDEADLNEYFWEKVDPERFFRIELEKDAASLVGEVTVLGRRIELTLSGAFEVTGPAEVTFVPKGAAVQQYPIPNFLLEAVLRDNRMILPLHEIPLPIAIENVKLEDGRVFLYGTKRL